MTQNENDQQSRRRFLGEVAAVSLAATTHVAAEELADRKRIYIAADDHTDYMWTADEAAYRQAFLKMLDHYLDLADRTDGEDSDYQSRWNCDGLLWFREFQQNRSGNEVARLVQRIKSGHISIPMTVLVSCYGGAPTEAVLRGLYYGGQVEREFDLRLRIAVAMENQTLPYGLGMLWAGSGVRYSWKGICGCASKLPNAGDREHDVYWWVGPDESRILMKWYSLGPKLKNGMYSNEGPGGYAEARDPGLAIEYVDSDEGFRRRNPHSVIGLFGQGWDDLFTKNPLNHRQRSFPVVAKVKSNKTRRVIVSDENDYFADMEKTHGKELPEVRAAYGNEWDLYSASLAEVSASVKRATEKLRAAEAMASVVTCHRPSFAADLKEMRDQAWIAFGLYWEHDWTADGPISRSRRAAWQRKIAKQIVDYVEMLHARARTMLGELISVSKPSTYYVFNPLGWNRTDVAEVELNAVGDFEMVDVLETTQVESQVIVRDGKRYLQFLASDVPAIGYKVFRMSRQKMNARATSVSLKSDGVLSSSFHQLKLRPDGSFGSWRCKHGHGDNSHERDVMSDSQVANYIADGAGQWRVESAGSVSTTLRIDIPRPLSRSTRVTLYENIDRIDIENTITQNFRDVLTWRFDFQFDEPNTYHEEVGAILNAAYRTADGHYAKRNSRTDWLTLNHFAAMHDEEMVVTLSASDAQFFHLGDDAPDEMKPNFLQSESQTLQVLAGGQVDGPKLGIQSQGGDSRFLQRFSLRCEDYAAESSPSRSMRMSLEHQNPLVTGVVSTNRNLSDGDTPSLDEAFSLVSIDSDDVIIWAVKPAEDGPGSGLVVRLWNLSLRPSDYALQVRLSEGTVIKRCMRVTHVETDEVSMDVVNGVVREKIPARSIRTLRCW